MQMNLWIILFSLVVLGGTGAAVADTDSKEVQAMTKQIAVLTDEVARLLKAVRSLQAIQPTIASLMPEFSERFHVMHYAGEAEDWAVASHELFGLKRLIEIMKQVDPEKGSMVYGFLLKNFNDLDADIEHKNLESFQNSLIETTKNCNTCHAAVGSPWMKVVLDARESLSMRHSHDLNKSVKPGEHTHMQ